MLDLFISNLKQYARESNEELGKVSFLLSFSGGIDSTVMASLLLEMRKKHIFKFGFAHINHHAHSVSDNAEIFTSQFSNKNNVPFYNNHLYIDINRNFECCARTKRYELLKNIAIEHSYHFILTAHHQDDQLETIYMKKVDGGDWISQIGIRERMGILRRPLLNISKEEILKYANYKNLQWFDDPTNSNLNIRRNNIRLKQLPRAINENSGLKKVLLSISKQYSTKLRKTEIKLKYDKNKVIIKQSKDHVQINRKEIGKYEIEELKLFIYIIIGPILKIVLLQYSRAHWIGLKDFIKQSTTGSIYKIDMLTFIINRNEIIVTDKYNNMKTFNKLRLCNNLLWYSGQFKMRNKTKAVLSSSKKYFSIANSIYQDGLYIRRWKYGDRIISATSQKHVLLSDLYINNKLSKYDKLTQPVVVNASDRIFWIPGLLHGKIDYKNKDKIKIINWVQK